MALLTCSVLVIIALATAPVRSHGGLNNYTVGDTWYRGYDPFEADAEQDGRPWMVQRKWSTIDPVFDLSSPAMACNTPGTAAASYIPVAAGANLTAVYMYWLHPVGPMTAWLAACGDGGCAAADPNRLDWFKIWEAGLLDGNVLEGLWYQKAFQKWDGTPDEWSVTVPAALRSGLYLVRHEILSIHVASKPQFYPECAHLNVTGGGDALPPRELTVRFPGAYSMDDPAISIDIYAPEMATTYNYTIAGPPVWTGNEDDSLHEDGSDGGEVVNKYCLNC